jgi:uncharacterized protein
MVSQAGTLAVPRQRLWDAVKTLPSRRQWLECLALAAAALPVMALAGWQGAFVGFAPEGDPGTWLRFAALLFLAPALGEELLFRALLVAPPTQPASASKLTLAVAAFVAWHPLQAWTIGPPWAGLFLNPWFLLATAALGAALVAQYRRTGSLWPCVLTHWLVVLFWKLVFAGPIA